MERGIGGASPNQCQSVHLPEQALRLISTVYHLFINLFFTPCNLTLYPVFASAVRTRLPATGRNEWIWRQQLESDQGCRCPGPVVSTAAAGPLWGQEQHVSQLGRQGQCASWAQLQVRLGQVKQVRLSVQHLDWDRRSQLICLVPAADVGRRSVCVFTWFDPKCVKLANFKLD